MCSSSRARACRRRGGPDRGPGTHRADRPPSPAGAAVGDEHRPPRTAAQQPGGAGVRDRRAVVAVLRAPAQPGEHRRPASVSGVDRRGAPQPFHGLAVGDGVVLLRPYGPGCPRRRRRSRDRSRKARRTGWPERGDPETGSRDERTASPRPSRGRSRGVPWNPATFPYGPGSRCPGPFGVGTGTIRPPARRPVRTPPLRRGGGRRGPRCSPPRLPGRPCPPPPG